MQYVIKNLSEAPLHTIVDCLNESFKDYFVKLPSDVEFWRKRFTAALVDYTLSYGAFLDDQLIGYFVNAVDVFNGKLTAYNSGTGIIEAHRGKRLVQSMYDKALEDISQTNIEVCTLEVIVQNIAAIKSYTRVGFQVHRRLKCYKGQLNFSQMPDLIVEKTSIPAMDFNDSFQDYSWDHTLSTLARSKSGVETYTVSSGKKKHPLGHFIIKQTSNLAQIESYTGDYEPLFSAISAMSPSIRIINIDEKRKDLIAFLDKNGFENTIDQYEMEMKL